MGIVYNEMTKETERLFQNSKNVKYWPYIGKGYFKCKTKILVLGESHYLTDLSRIKEMENYSGWTNEVVIWAYLDQGYSQNFSSFDDFPKWISLPKDSYLKGYRNTAKMLVQNVYSKNNYTKQGADYVWKNLAFYNFFQRPVACRPGRHDWLMADYDNYVSQARLAFSEVMDKLNPHVVIVWGKKDLYKNWLPANKEQLYPNSIFFPINHPSYNIRRKYIEKWNELVRQRNIDEGFAQHNPIYKRVETIFFDDKLKKFIGPFSKWYGERSIGYRMNSKSGDSNAIVLLVTMSENGETVLTLSTRKELDSETIKIVKNPSFDIFERKRSLNCDGLFELCTIASNATDEDVISKILIALKAMKDCSEP